MSGLGDKMIDFYFGVDYEIVWNAIFQRLPSLRREIKKVLKEFNIKDK